MLEILVVMTAIAIFVMAAHRRRRKMGRYIRGNIDLNLSLGTLAGATSLIVPTNTLAEKAFVSSVKCLYSLAGVTPIENNGPVQVGVAHSDYTQAEIEEWIERTSSWSEGDKVAQEVSNRLIRSIGVFADGESAAGAVNLNDGKPITTKLNWTLISAQGLNFWVYNEGSVAFATTDPNCHIKGHANLWPR